MVNSMNANAATHKMETAIGMIEMNIKCLEKGNTKVHASVHFWIETWIKEVTDADAFYTEWQSSQL